MNNEEMIFVCPAASEFPEIVMRRNDPATPEDLRYEITADENGSIQKICGEFGEDIKTAARILLQTLLRLDISQKNALNAAKEFYLKARLIPVRIR